VVLRSLIRNFVVGLLFCVLATPPIFAQSIVAGSSEKPLPSQLMLQATPGSKSGTYQDASGTTYNVSPQNAGGTLCDPHGCVVQVCQGGACSYNYCTAASCRRMTVGVPGADRKSSS
jgi:hypothetical protein